MMSLKLIIPLFYCQLTTDDSGFERGNDLLDAGNLRQRLHKLRHSRLVYAAREHDDAVIARHQRPRIHECARREANGFIVVQVIDMHRALTRDIGEAAGKYTARHRRFDVSINLHITVIYGYVDVMTVIVGGRIFLDDVE